MKNLGISRIDSDGKATLWAPYGVEDYPYNMQLEVGQTLLVAGANRYSSSPSGVEAVTIEKFYKNGGMRTSDGTRWTEHCEVWGNRHSRKNLRIPTMDDVEAEVNIILGEYEAAQEKKRLERQKKLDAAKAKEREAAAHMRKILDAAKTSAPSNPLFTTQFDWKSVDTRHDSTVYFQLLSVMRQRENVWSEVKTVYTFNLISSYQSRHGSYEVSSDVFESSDEDEALAAVLDRVDHELRWAS